LHIAFYFHGSVKSFQYNKTHYYPIFRNNSDSKTKRYLTRLFKNENNDKKEIVGLFDIIKEIKPDLIHIHGTEDNFGLIQKHIEIPTIISIQGLLNPYSEKFFSGIPLSVTKKYDSISSKLFLKSANYYYNQITLKSIREREILKLSKNIIGRTDWDKRVTRLLSSESNYYIGQEIIRDSFFLNFWKKIKFETKIQIITISSDFNYKGFETIVKSARELTLINDFEFNWIVIGLNSNSQIVKCTERWLKVCSSDFNINLVGVKNDKEILDLLLNADIYCQVSHIENSPNSLCEAMLIGLPIVSSFAGGTDSLLENKKEGILVQDGDPYSFAGAILEMNNNFELAQRFANAARTRAIVRHNKANITNDLIKLYKNVIRN
jgi:glycosyltransferase involved in cell wall biosynthesis